MNIKREMIHNAFRWREEKRKQAEEELLIHSLELFILIITICQINYIYKEFFYYNYKYDQTSKNINNTIIQDA